MRHQACARHRPLFCEGPAWRQLTREAQQQVVQRLTDLCCEIVNEHTPEPPPRDQEQPHDGRKD